MVCSLVLFKVIGRLAPTILCCRYQVWAHAFSKRSGWPGRASCFQRRGTWGSKAHREWLLETIHHILKCKADFNKLQDSCNMAFLQQSMLLRQNFLALYWYQNRLAWWLGFPWGKYSRLSSLCVWLSLHGRILVLDKFRWTNWKFLFL